jgi:hypothetical protein
MDMNVIMQFYRLIHVGNEKKLYYRETYFLTRGGGGVKN